jgi:hypothetical protein
MEISRVLTFSKLEKIYESKGLRRDQLIEAVLKIARFVRQQRKQTLLVNIPQTISS